MRQAWHYLSGMHGASDAGVTDEMPARGAPRQRSAQVAQNFSRDLCPTARYASPPGGLEDQLNDFLGVVALSAAQNARCSSGTSL